MKVNIITPVHTGGPYNSGKNLAKILNNRGITTSWTHKLPEVLLSPFWQNADIVHSMGIPIGFRLWRKPLVLTMKGEYTIENNLWQPLYPGAIRHANVVTTPSFFLKERLNLKNALVIPNAVFLENFHIVTHSEKSVVNLLTTTNFSFKDKSCGILDILEILDSIPKEDSQPINYTIAGGGPYLAMIENNTKKYATAANFKGWINNLDQFLQSGDIFVYYSCHDNFPNAILEAMACGLPVITNKVGAVSEIIDNGVNGFIANNHQEYKEHLTALIANIDLRSLIGNNARKTIEAKFDWNIIAQKYIDIYKKL
jgi:glycosyltransferase involved in cell wall biosynthesis